MVGAALMTYLYYVVYGLRQNGQPVGKKVMRLWADRRPHEKAARTAVVTLG